MIVFTEHALMKLAQRNIARERVIETLMHPDRRTESYGNRRVCFKKFGKLYLKIIYRTENNDAIVITEHWVEKI